MKITVQFPTYYELPKFNAALFRVHTIIDRVSRSKRMEFNEQFEYEYRQRFYNLTITVENDSPMITMTREQRQNVVIAAYYYMQRVESLLP